jgi:uncharacterized membrane protein
MLNRRYLQKKSAIQNHECEVDVIMKYGVAFFAAIVAMVLLDIAWFKLVMGSLFRSELGDAVLESPRMAAAAAFYTVYSIGIVVFIVVPTQSLPWERALWLGALFGFVAYGTYDLTNMATLKMWTWKVAGIDILWGAFATAVSAVVGRMAIVLAT